MSGPLIHPSYASYSALVYKCWIHLSLGRSSSSPWTVQTGAGTQCALILSLGSCFICVALCTRMAFLNVHYLEAERSLEKRSLSSLLVLHRHPSQWFQSSDWAWHHGESAGKPHDNQYSLSTPTHMWIHAEQVQQAGVAYKQITEVQG